MGKRGRRNRTRRTILESKAEVHRKRDLLNEKAKQDYAEYRRFRNFTPVKTVNNLVQVLPRESFKRKGASIGPMLASVGLWSHTMADYTQRQVSKRVRAHEAIYCVCIDPEIDPVFKRCKKCRKRPYNN